MATRMTKKRRQEVSYLYRIENWPVRMIADKFDTTEAVIVAILGL